MSIKDFKLLKERFDILCQEVPLSAYGDCRIKRDFIEKVINSEVSFDEEYTIEEYYDDCLDAAEYFESKYL